ncbi:estradiol 17-beta-dehydrogenase 8-like [Acanthaster planci]|uniref:(3R)-3-hydroxyacyl-CoA dehydrogenase n=1 Tax=Acanthaster planci TaxID=133434 RepID=A0A8B7YPW7_ACAPL|nr:estradiol 17-beta-dehydrogenase 8-like [Acanthaster planci]
MATSLQLFGRVALVTGGGSGIGRAVCELFAKNGASVVAADINLDSVKTTVGKLTADDNRLSGTQSHHAFALDVSDKVAVQSLVKNVSELYQQPASILVNSAGITRDKTMMKMEEKNFDKVIDVNLKGTFLVTQAVSKAMIEHRTTDGSIVNIASIVGKYGNVGQCNYSASKAGVVGFTKTTARELGRYGIRCNVILPGFIKTPMTDAVPIQNLSLIRQFIPLKREGEPSEVAEVCLFLASKRSSYMTGAEVEVTGGLVN